jgi:hypothetical protein
MLMMACLPNRLLGDMGHRRASHNSSIHRKIRVCAGEPMIRCLISDGKDGYDSHARTIRYIFARDIPEIRNLHPPDDFLTVSWLTINGFMTIPGPRIASPVISSTPDYRAAAVKDT